MENKNKNNVLRKRIGFLLVIGAAALAVAFVLGVALNTALGPAFGGIANAFATAFVIGVAIVGVKTWYSPIVVWTVFGALAWPLTTMGPPGPHKIAIGLLAGGEVALFLIGAQNKTWRYAIAGAVMSILMTYLILVAMLQLNLSPESAAKLQEALKFLLPIYGFLGAAGMAAASSVYNRRLSRMSFFQTL